MGSLRSLSHKQDPEKVRVKIFSSNNGTTWEELPEEEWKNLDITDLARYLSQYPYVRSIRDEINEHS